MTKAPDTAPADEDFRQRRCAARWEDRVLAGLLLGFGGLRVGITIGAHQRFGAEASIGLLMVILGVALLIWKD